MYEIHTKEIVQDKLNSAIERLMYLDSYLLKMDTSERSITHKLAIYIQEEFKNWDVDCEYNRVPHETTLKKTIRRAYKKRLDDDMKKLVYPDIIVHHRGTDDNLLVIEFKKSTSTTDDDFDYVKLKAYREQLNYKYAVFVKLYTEKKLIGLKECQFI